MATMTWKGELVLVRGSLASTAATLTGSDTATIVKRLEYAKKHLEEAIRLVKLEREQALKNHKLYCTYQNGDGSIQSYAYNSLADITEALKARSLNESRILSISVVPTRTIDGVDFPDTPREDE